MKKVLCLIMAVLLCVLLCGCGNSTEKQTDNSSEKIDVDLTTLSSTMVYSEVNNMVTTPSDYIGKRVKMQGAFAVYEEGTDVYLACIIADATACCQQGLEFSLKEQKQYPNDFPDLGTEITVVGIFSTYKQGENLYCQLTNAEMI